jgi:Protein of unknown function (DUF2793)
MPLENSPRHDLPFLSVGQAQKELTHNEALVRIDALLHPAIEAVLAAPPVLTDTDIGKCWLIASSASGIWAGKASQIANWMGGGWRYLDPVHGMRVRLLSNDTEMLFINGDWISAPVIADPTGGTTIDVEARATIAALLSHFRVTGRFAG